MYLICFTNKTCLFTKSKKAKTRQFNTIQGNTRQFKAIQDNIRQFKAIQGNTRHTRHTRHTRQFKTIQAFLHWVIILPVVMFYLKVLHQFLYRCLDNRTNVSQVIHKSSVVIKLINIKVMSFVKHSDFIFC